MDITRRRLLQLGNAMAGLALLPPDTRALAVKAAAAPVDPPPALDDYFSLFDFEERALATLAPPIRAFVAGAAGDELTMRWNRESLDRIRLAPRNLHDVARVATHTVAPGLDSPIPILVAPIGFQRMMHADGEVATVRGRAPPA